MDRKITEKKSVFSTSAFRALSILRLRGMVFHHKND